MSHQHFQFPLSSYLGPFTIFPFSFPSSPVFLLSSSLLSILLYIVFLLTPSFSLSSQSFLLPYSPFSSSYTIPLICSVPYLSRHCTTRAPSCLRASYEWGEMLGQWKKLLHTYMYEKVAHIKEFNSHALNITFVYLIHDSTCMMVAMQCSCYAVWSCDPECDGLYLVNEWSE